VIAFEQQMTATIWCAVNVDLTATDDQALRGKALHLIRLLSTQDVIALFALARFGLRQPNRHLRHRVLLHKPRQNKVPTRFPLVSPLDTVYETSLVGNGMTSDSVVSVGFGAVLPMKIEVVPKTYETIRRLPRKPLRLRCKIAALPLS